MKNIIKISVLLSIGLIFSSCTKQDIATPTASGTWYIDWVNDFVIQLPDGGRTVVPNLCNDYDPAKGNTVKINFAGSARTVWQGTPQSGKVTDPTYLTLGSRNDNSNTLTHANHSLTCDDLVVTSIEHREIYVTGQPGHIKKRQAADGSCELYAEPGRARPKITVFVSVAGRGKKFVNGQEQYDDNNRIGGFTARCDDGAGLETVFRTSSASAKGSIGFLADSAKVKNTDGIISGLMASPASVGGKNAPILETKTNKELL